VLLELSNSAETDIENISDYIAHDSPASALAWLLKLRSQFDRISRFPSIYTQRPELALGLRTCAYGNYVIFFTLTDSYIRIERVLHSARNVDPLFLSGLEDISPPRYIVNQP
jgi:toxin ParE1/3/4